jgi:hypothetical protein
MGWEAWKPSLRCAIHTSTFIGINNAAARNLFASHPTLLGRINDSRKILGMFTVDYGGRKYVFCQVHFAFSLVNLLLIHSRWTFLGFSNYRIFSNNSIKADAYAFCFWFWFCAAHSHWLKILRTLIF